jgi:AAA domain
MSEIEFAPGLPTVDVEEVKPWFVDAADLLAEPDPGPTPWLIENLIVDQALVACVGRWKTTKSYGLLDLCISVATGRPAFGALKVRQGRVVFVNEESGRAALWRRLDALCRGRAIDPEELRGRLIVSANARVKLDDPRWQNELVELGKDLRPRLFVFDPLARMKASKRDENAQTDMAAVVEFWRYLRDETSAAVGLVHHSGHSGDHMRGSSDLETAWETRLAWKRESQAAIVEIESEHREAEAAGTIRYRIGWDAPTRTMRFDLERDPLEENIRRYLVEHPDASANEVDEHVDGNRQKILALVKTIREGGSDTLEPPRNHPLAGTTAGGSPAPLFRGAGTTTAVPGSGTLEPPSPNGSVDQGEVERIAALFLDTEPDVEELAS